MKHVRSENDAKLWSGNFKEGGNFRNCGRNGRGGGGMILEGRLKK